MLRGGRCEVWGGRGGAAVESLFQLVLEEKQVEPTRLHKEAIMEHRVLIEGVHDLLHAGFLTVQARPCLLALLSLSLSLRAWHLLLCLLLGRSRASEADSPPSLQPVPQSTSHVLYLRHVLICRCQFCSTAIC